MSTRHEIGFLRFFSRSARTAALAIAILGLVSCGSFRSETPAPNSTNAVQDPGGAPAAPGPAAPTVPEVGAGPTPVYSLMGDAGNWTKKTKSQLDSMVRLGVKTLVMPGDNLYGGTYQKQWDPWIKAGFKFDVVAIGNHNDGYPNEVAFFKMPGEYYSKSVPGLVRFVVLNSDNSKNVPAQMKFLEAELSAATEPFVFLVYHHPTFTISRSHFWTDRRAFQLALRPMLVKYRKTITAVIVGHDHLAALGHFGDLPYILTGASWEARSDSPVNNVQSGTNVSTDWFFDGTSYWVRLSFQGAGAARSAKAEYIRASDDKVRCTALLSTGKKAALQPDCSAK